MRQNLEANEIDPDEIPVVLQYNKRDLPNALPIEILNERMNPRNYPFYEAIAVKGVGVEDTLKAVTKLVFKALSVRYGDGAAAPSAPGRAPGPPRRCRPRRRPPPRPLSPSRPTTCWASSTSACPSRRRCRPRPPTCRRSSSTRTRPSDRSTRTPAPARRVAPAAPAARPAPAPAAPAARPAPVAPARASVPAEPARAPLAAHRPQNTLVSKPGRGRRAAPAHCRARDACRRRRDGPRGGRRLRPPDPRQARAGSRVGHRRARAPARARGRGRHRGRGADRHRGGPGHDADQPQHQAAC